MKIIKEARRKELRYLMFAKKNGSKLPNPVFGARKDKQVLKYYEEQTGFTSWDEFETRWDIGMKGDTIAIANRPEKWYLFDYDKLQIVPRPKNYWEEEAKRKGTIAFSLYQQECNRRQISMDQFFNIFF